ncbi:MAG: hypothetical protein KIS92_08335 [Planctomycetota bacterium]|nr:hypothetical protein [Planctomycetota bacterium]
MGLLDRLRAVGSRLKIIQSVRILPAAAPARVETRSVTLAELTTEIKAEEVRSLAGQPEEFAAAFERLYEAAGIAPAEGAWTVFTLQDLLEKEPLKSMDRGTAQKMLQSKLAEAQVAVEDVVKDAVARDQALDAFEAALKGRLEAREALRQRKIAELEQLELELLRLREECGALGKSGESDRRQFGAWKERKAAEERRLAWTVGYLLDEPVITTEPKA